MNAATNLRRFDLDRLRDIVGVADVLRTYGVETGRGRRMSCPIHAGDNPTAFSFTHALWHCFSCGAGGDIFALITALTSCSFPEAVAIVARLAGLSLDGLPQIEPAEYERSRKIARRRAALKAWRDQRLNEWLTLIGNLDREARLLAPHYMNRARDQQDPDGEGWRLLASLHGDLQIAEHMAAGLTPEDEAEWAALWLAEQRQKVPTPEELRT